MDNYSQMASVMKALGHPVRLQIVAVLQQGEACVCHLEAVLGLRQAYISQHLMRLREAGLVVDNREGMNVYYALADEGIVRLLDAAMTISANLPYPSTKKTFTFSPPPDPPPTCTCPKCQQKMAASNILRAKVSTA